MFRCSVFPSCLRTCSEHARNVRNSVRQRDLWQTAEPGHINSLLSDGSRAGGWGLHSCQKVKANMRHWRRNKSKANAAKLWRSSEHWAFPEAWTCLSLHSGSTWNIRDLDNVQMVCYVIRLFWSLLWESLHQHFTVSFEQSYRQMHFMNLIFTANHQNKSFLWLEEIIAEIF